MVALRTYLEGRVGQHLHFAKVLRPETLLKRLQTRRLQAITGAVLVGETIMRSHRHRGYRSARGGHAVPFCSGAEKVRALHAM